MVYYPRAGTPSYRETRVCPFHSYLYKMLIGSVFGRVIHGMEHIDKIGKLETDSKDRPLLKVVISHCGELELRKAPPARRPATPLSDSASASDSEAEERRRREAKARKREKRDRKDRNGETSEERRERRARKKERSGRSKKEDEEETIEELDARLEREEKARLEIEAAEKLEAAKKERERLKAEGGVVYKGKHSDQYLYRGCAGLRL